MKPQRVGSSSNIGSGSSIMASGKRGAERKSVTVRLSGDDDGPASNAPPAASPQTRSADQPGRRTSSAAMLRKKSRPSANKRWRTCGRASACTRTTAGIPQWCTTPLCPCAGRRRFFSALWTTSSCRRRAIRRPSAAR